MNAPSADSPLAWGTAGWDTDAGVHYEIGDATNDGNTLIRVTLFRGRDPKIKLDQKIAQGQKLLCKMASSFVQVPLKGTRVLVAIPEPFGMIPGGSVVIAADNPNPAMVGNLKPGEAGMAAATGAARILCKDGAVVIYTTNDNTPQGTGVQGYWGSKKIQIGNEFGSLTIDSNGITLTVGSASLTLAPGGIAKLLGTQVSVLGSVAHFSGQAGTFIGPAASYVPIGLGCAYGPLGPVNLVSTTVFISP